MIIALGGPSGVGKSEVSARIAVRYSLPRLSAGRYFRELANQMATDVYQLSDKALKHNEIDKNLTALILEEVARIKSCVIDGHGVCLFLNDKHVFKILLFAPLDIRVERISKRDNESFSSVKQRIVGLDNNTSMRFKELYGKDIYDIETYDLAINTAKCNLNEIDEVICNFIEAKGLLR